MAQEEAKRSPKGAKRSQRGANEDLFWSPEADKTSPRARPTKTFVKHESRSVPGSLGTWSGGAKLDCSGAQETHNVLMKMRPLETRYKIQDLRDFDIRYSQVQRLDRKSLAAWWPRGAGGYIYIYICMYIFIYIYIYI